MTQRDEKKSVSQSGKAPRRRCRIPGSSMSRKVKQRRQKRERIPTRQSRETLEEGIGPQGVPS